MTKKVLVLFVCVAAIFGFFYWAEESAAEENRQSFMDAIFSAIESSANLDLSDENMEIVNDEPDTKEDTKFMGLLRAKLRLAHIFRQLEYPDTTLSVLNGYEFVRMIMTASSSGSLNAADAPFDLGDYIVYQMVLPLGLEPLIRELPAYYKAVKSKDDWQEKFDLILDTGDEYGPALNKGKTFHLAGFPKVNGKKDYVTAINVSLNDDALSLGEYDSSIEAWLYSFWLRRYKDGSLEIVKTILDWLNTRLDAAESAAG